MTVAVNRLANGTIELTITIPWSDVKTIYDKVVNEFVKKEELPGFRKGKAPRKLVEENLDNRKVYEEVLKQVIPGAYTDAVRQENLTPIISPRIEVIATQDGKDWQFRAQTCERPEVKLGNYKEALSLLKKTKPAKIWVPGKTEKDEKSRGVSLEELIKTVLEISKIQIPALLIEDGVNRMLSRLIDQTQKLGLTVEQYLQSSGKTIDSLRTEYRNQSAYDLALEFVLETIADQEKIQVDDEEIEKFIEKVKDASEKESLRTQGYYIASVLRKQKTLDYLKSLAD